MFDLQFIMITDPDVITWYLSRILSSCFIEMMELIAINDWILWKINYPLLTKRFQVSVIHRHFLAERSSWYLDDNGTLLRNYLFSSVLLGLFLLRYPILQTHQYTWIISWCKIVWPTDFMGLWSQVMNRTRTTMDATAKSYTHKFDKAS